MFQTMPLWPVRASTTANSVDALYIFLLVVSGLMSAAIFSQFFLLTLYMQQVLHYSALKTGAAYIALTLSIIVFSTVSQAMVTKLGIRRILPAGLATSAGALLLFARLPVDGHYLTDLLPPFLLSGIGLALAFVYICLG